MSAAAPLVRALRLKYPQYPLVLTTATLTGRARAAGLFGDGAEVRFLPYDTPGAVARFLDRIRPCLAIIVETELWPNLFAECERRGVPLVLASARLSAKSVARYRRLGNLFRGVFSASSLVAAQTAEDAERFIAIGAPQCPDSSGRQYQVRPEPGRGGDRQGARAACLIRQRAADVDRRQHARGRGGAGARGA